MKMNLKVRLKNKKFWLTAIPTTVAFIYSMLSLFDVVPNISEAVVVKLLTTLITALSLLGVLNDPTTEGFADSERAMTYEVPYARQKQKTEKRFSLFSFFKRKDGDE